MFKNPITLYCWGRPSKLKPNLNHCKQKVDNKV